MATTPASAEAMTVDELARHAGLPVRTIREYQTMRLVPAPQRAGRVGLYGTEHRRRLELIARLQRRGYSLAGIRDLLESWESGANLPDLLGVDVGPAALDETPLRLTREELSGRVPALTPAGVRRAQQVGLLVADGRRHFLVRSPALLALIADGIDAGIDIGDLLNLVGDLRDQLDGVAEGLAQRIVSQVWEPLTATGRAAQMDPFLRRGRLLLLQGVVSILADRLGVALVEQARSARDGDQLLAAIDRIRVGAVADATGAIHNRKEHS